MTAMTTHLVVSLALAGSLAAATLASASSRFKLDEDDLKFVGTVKDATILLYKQTEDGNFNGFCTATAFEREGEIVRFITAAHCVARDDLKANRVVIEEDDFWAVFDSPERAADMKWYRLRVAGAGFRHAKDDCAVLETAALDREVPLVTVSREGKTRHLEPVINVAGANGLGFLTFTGTVTLPALDRPIRDRRGDWQNAIVLDLAAAKRSSGSAVVSLARRAIIGIISGTYTDDALSHTIATPAERCHRVWRQIQADEYPWFTKPRRAADRPRPDDSAAEDDNEKFDTLLPDP
jgi:S1-C subfamily serine protease